MDSRFSRCLAVTLEWEGGFSDHPSDPGGATMKGVTLKRYAAYKGRSVTVAELKSIGRVELEDIYRRGYWAPVGGDNLPEGLDLCMFDYAVNSGPARAIRELQRILGVTADGQMGVLTLEALKNRGKVDLIHALCDARLRFLKSLRTWNAFGKGWERRVAGIRAKAISMASGGAGRPSPGVPTPKANPADVKVTKKPNATEKIVAGGGVAGTVLADAAAQLTPFSDISAAVKWVCFALVAVGVGIMLWRLFKAPQDA